MGKISDIREVRALLRRLVRNDLRARYSGSVFGVVWAYVQPLVTILVFWYVFQIGFRNPPVDNVEYILWFIAGYIPWTFFNDGILSSANVFYEYAYLVKKIRFRVWMLPVIKVLSSVYIHLFFLVFLVGMYLVYGYAPQAAWLSIVYYTLCLFVLLVGCAYLLSSLSVFFKDAAQLVSVILQILFWLTPIFWSDAQMNETALSVLKCNPLYYIVTGYRDALIGGVWFWREPVWGAVWFWGVAAGMLWGGTRVYRRLKIHFADLL